MSPGFARLKFQNNLINLDLDPANLYNLHSLPEVSINNNALYVLCAARIIQDTMYKPSRIKT
jgi:hypothetical protein